MNTIKKSIAIALSIFMLIANYSKAQPKIKNAVAETFTVYGNCNMCKQNIEKAAYKKGVSKAVWNEETKLATVTYNTKKTTADAVFKNIAYAGYDNDKYMAPTEAYNKLMDCCKYKRMFLKEALPPVENIKVENIKTEGTPTEIVNPLATVYTAYFGLKDALAKDEGTTAATKAKELYKAIDAVPMEKLTTAQHTVWMKYEKQLSYDAEHIKGVTETEHQREHFISLSKNMFEVMKVIKYDATVYYDFCPMANDGKGANWLSLEKPIINPYFGKQMLNCGKVQETIK